MVRESRCLLSYGLVSLANRQIRGATSWKEQKKKKSVLNYPPCNNNWGRQDELPVQKAAGSHSQTSETSQQSQILGFTAAEATKQQQLLQLPIS
ncbi:unnamed protein product [Linum trigynum]|uniref:Uncharacterized protein n=1 Tax=Linum trigynum TaxID=586398 RepID=A0AAV2GDK9_9ROSI